MINFHFNMRTIIIKEHLEELLNYLQPLLPLANFHMVDYFTDKDPLKTFFVENIIEIEALGVEKTVKNLFEDDYSKLPNLEKYVNLCKKFSLKNCPNVCLNINDLQKELLLKGTEELSQLKMNVFMSSKKSHEVEVMSSVCAKIHLASKTSHLVDIGDGKGYLSSFLSLHYKIPVLGVDASEVNTDGAVKRVQRLSKVWNSLTNENNVRKSKQTSSDLYKQTTMFVDENINIKKLISHIFLNTPKSIGLVGLHTCGDLSASSIKVFIADDDIKTLCNVGCCYHFIKEHFEGYDLNQYGFPLSNYLQSKHIIIGRAARMIAAQSIERILDKKEFPNKTIFYRSLYEVLLKRNFPSLSSIEKQVGRFRKECSTFEEYVQKASQRLDLEIDINGEEILQLYEEYKNRRHELNLFYILRGLLSSSIESLILLDRLLFLLENGFEKSYLVHLFNPVISPRCYGLISIK